MNPACLLRAVQPAIPEAGALLIRECTHGSPSGQQACEVAAPVFTPTSPPKLATMSSRAALRRAVALGLQSQRTGFQASAGGLLQVNKRPLAVGHLVRSDVCA